MSFDLDAQVRCAGWAKCLVVASGFFLLTGCGLFEGKSEYQQMLDKRNAFSEMIADAGGSAVMEKRSMHGLNGVGWFIDLSGAELDDALLNAIAEVAKEKSVYELNLADSSITDEQLAQLDKDEVLQKVFFLDLSNTKITDAGLDSVSNIYVIHELNLKGTAVTEAAVKRLGDKQMAQKQTPDAFRTRPKTDI
ncbi:hypothetical protein [Symmachiella dynata]|uniref:Leucine Rich repeats (2 copies) n=1 Tax=Symmachiella dynata TaxID=2527995 RepID=A0A517ZJ10_9PLAN|nr:hypothetical protein [Symmachiella dynata]QDU42472.1 hypothetical protein Mal52_09330 [Symmachiella dynata]|tara:strand:- start:127 stop:705 length:579 start_codon:yes stop_codon:yes gene_type:complete